MTKYRKKPVVIDAWEITRDNCEVLAVMCGGQDIPFGIKIPTLEGDMIGNWGDYLIRGVQGEYYPCNPDIFEETYERYSAT